MTVQEIVKNIRFSLGLSQMAFSKQMHVSFSTVNRWENGRAQPNKLAIVMLIELCQKEQVCKEFVPELQRLSESKPTSD
jgi:putative transcriptional regulator